MSTKRNASSQARLSAAASGVPDDDDDFEVPMSWRTTQQNLTPSSSSSRKRGDIKINITNLSSKQPKLSSTLTEKNRETSSSGTDDDELCSLDLIESSIDCTQKVIEEVNEKIKIEEKDSKGLEANGGYTFNSIEARLMRSRVDSGANECVLQENITSEDSEEGSELDVLIKLCEDDKEEVDGHFEGNSVHCPVCGLNISDLNEESRLLHSNDCLDKEENRLQDVILANNEKEAILPPRDVDDHAHSPPRVIDVSPVLEWLRDLGLERYGEAFMREEIDMYTLRWLTEEDLLSIGVSALGPRKKIAHALDELRKNSLTVSAHRGKHASGDTGSGIIHGTELKLVAPEVTGEEISKAASNKLITDYFLCSSAARKKTCTVPRKQVERANTSSGSARKSKRKSSVGSRNLKNIPVWCSIPGTPFRVDAFKYLRGDCSHWFLTHFHMDHYQGLTKSFRHGKIYCSLITAKLVNMKIGIPWERLEVLPLNRKITIAGIGVTCLDANHCPGAIIILFEPPNSKAVLHTGDFRVCEKMISSTVWQSCSIHTLILDTTYCNPQYDFPKQEDVIQFVIEAIQAEAFNPKTLFLIGSYTIGKERVFLEVARVLRKKIHVSAAKFRLLECLGLSDEDMRWFTLNPQESHIHVVPMWSIASFKRLKLISSQYADRFSLIVAFSPSGWAFGKMKKKSPGKRWQQGTIIRYEVPYSEHSSFSELKEFVKAISPENIIPSVNNTGPDSANTMVSLLLS